jgi:mono/diheme cytochrome c family protein
VDDIGHNRLLFLGLIITIAIFAAGAVYWLAEPARMRAAEQELVSETVEHGRRLYAENCVACHGPNGEGVPNVGTPLNTQEFLKTADDGTIFDTINDGRPGTAMPAWGQDHGGTMNAQDMSALAAYIRDWEATAPETQPAARRSPDAAAGGVIFSTTCFACHGIDGEGTAVAPALNVPELLATYGDDYFRETIANGRPSRGMPTWGKVLSPAEVDDVVAFMRSWEQAPAAGATAVPGGDPIAGATIFSVTCLVCHGENGLGTEKAPPINRQDFLSAVGDVELLDIIAEGQLAKGMPRWGQVLRPAEIGDVVAFIRSWEAAAVVPVTPPPEGDVAAGARLYIAGCAACHGAAGEGAVGPSLRNNTFISEADDEALREVIVEGIPDTSMPPWEGDLSDKEVLDLVALMRNWQGLPALPPTPTSAPPPSTGNVENGATLYAANCLACHGEQGAGGIGPALKPSSFVKSAGDAELQQLVVEGLPGTGMPSFGNRLTADDIQDLVALMRAWQE